MIIGRVVSLLYFYFLSLQRYFNKMSNTIQSKPTSASHFQYVLSQCKSDTAAIPTILNFKQ